MQILKLCEKRYHQLHFVIKLLLYLIPLIIFLLYVIGTFNGKCDELKSDYNILKHKHTKLKKSMNQNPNLLQAFSLVENYIKKNHLEVLLLKQVNNALEIKVNIDKKKIVSFINFCEKFHPFSKIEQLTGSYTQDNYILQILLTFKNYYKKDTLLLDKQPLLDKKEKNSFKLFAIIDHNVLINNKWYQLNSFVNQMKIIKINANSIVLSKGKKEKILRLFDEIITTSY